MPPTCNSIRRNSHALLLWIRLWHRPAVPAGCSCLHGAWPCRAELYQLDVQNLVQGSLGRRYGCHGRSPHARRQRLQRRGYQGCRRRAHRPLQPAGQQPVSLRCQPFGRIGRKRCRRLSRGRPRRSAPKRLCHDEGAHRSRAGRQLYPEHLDHRVALGPVYEHRGTHDPRADLLLV